MKFILLFMIPISLLAQTIDYPDTIETLKGSRYPCLVLDLGQSYIQIKYGADLKATMVLKSLDAIIIEDYGKVYSKKDGYSKYSGDFFRFIQVRNALSSNKSPDDFKNLQQKNVSFNYSITLQNNRLAFCDSIKQVQGDSLVVILYGRTKLISMADIVKITKTVKSGSIFNQGAALGAAIGFFTGLLISGFAKPEPSDTWLQMDIGPGEEVAGGILGVTIGVFAGGLMGIKKENEIIFELSDHSDVKKIQIENMIRNQ